MRKSIYTIHKNDLIDCAKLIAKGYSLQESLRIIGNYDYIIEQLSKGNTIEQYIQLNKKNTFYNSLSFFLEISTFDQAIMSAYEYDTFKKKLKMDWMKEISYPMVLVLSTCAIYIFFNIYIYPQLNAMIPNESFLLNEILTLILMILLLSILIISMFLLTLKFIIKNNEIYYLKLIEILCYFPIFRKIISYDYAIHSLVLIKRGFSTKQVFESLLLLKNNQILKILLNKMVLLIQQGKEMIHVIEDFKYFESRFKHFYKIGYYSQNLENSINDYCIYQEYEFKKHLKYLSKFITLSSYVFVSIFIVTIYQMLLIPLEMIQQF